MTWDQWIERNRKAMADSRYELDFVKKVLSQVRGLRPESVSAQTPFKDMDGGNRRCDFTIREGDHVRIAIEVDGYDKTRSGRGMTRDEFNDWMVRQLGLTAAGWLPLRFPNGLIESRRKDFREEIELQLKMQRQAAGLIAQGGQAGSQAKHERDQLRRAAKKAKRDKRKAEEEVKRLRAQQTKTGASRLSESDRSRVLELEGEFERINSELQNERELRSETNKENKNLKYAVRIGLASLAVIGGLIALGIIVLTSGGSNQPAEVIATQSGDPIQARRCLEAISPGDLGPGNVGERVTVKSEVGGTFKSGDGPTDRVVLFLDPDATGEDIEVLIWSENFRNWKIPPEEKYDGEVIAVGGRLSTFNGALQIKANEPNDIRICR